MSDIYINGSLAKTRTIFGIYAHNGEIIKINAINIDNKTYGITGKFEAYINPRKEYVLGQTSSDSGCAVAAMCGLAINDGLAKSFESVISDLCIWNDHNSIIAYYGVKTKDLLRDAFNKTGVHNPFSSYINVQKSINKVLKKEYSSIESTMISLGLKPSSPSNDSENIVKNIYQMTSFIKFKKKIDTVM